MTAAAEYLEAAKIEEVAKDLEAAGYTVVRHVHEGDIVYDLVAAKDDRKVVYEVQAGSQLGKSAGTIRRLREQARERGYDEFRLVVVNPPRERVVEIPGLDGIFFDHMVNNIPQELDMLSSHTLLEGVSQLDINAITVEAAGIRVVGSGVVDVELEYGGGREPDGLSWETDFPFAFDVLLNHALEVEEVYELRIDTSSFYE